MGTSQLYSLTWGEFGTSLVSAVQLLRCHGDLVDVTLAAGGRSFPAHKIVLSAASPFLLELLKSTPCRHPVLLLAGVNAPDLEALLEFVYRGEVSVDPSQLPSLLQAAHCLNIQGLAPGALHPDVRTQFINGKHDDPTSMGAHQSLTRDVINTFIPVKRKKKGKRKSSEAGSASEPGAKKRRRPSHRARSEGGDSELPSSETDLMSNPEGSMTSEGSKIRGASDQPAICPLCGATLRQARNLRRHLEMLHFGAGKIPPPTDSESPPGENSPSATNPGHRSVSRGSSHQSVPTSPGAAGTPGSDQSATVVVMPSALCQPVMLASPEDPQHSAQQQQHQQQQQQLSQQQHTQQQHQQLQEQHHTRTSPPNLAHMLGPPLLPPPSVATSMMTHHHHQQFLRYPGHPADLLGRPEQHILRGVGIYTDTRLPRPDPGGGMGGTEM